MTAFARAIEPLAGRIRMMVGRATIAAVDDSTKMQSLQIELLPDETQDGVEHFQPYGFAAHPMPGAEAITLAVGGLRSHAVVLSVADRRYRLTGLAEGEVALHDDQGQVVHLTRDGIRIFTSLDCTIEAGGDMAIKAGGELLLDGATIVIGEGASLDAARKTDAVSGGAITGGSSKVKIA